MSQYSAAYADLHGAGDARLIALTIVKDEDLTARAFHATGAKLFLTVRDLEKGQKVVNSILSDDTFNLAKVILIKMELDSLVSVHAGAQEMLKSTLLKSSTLAFQSRVVCVSFTGHPVIIRAYGSSKSGSIYLANEIQRRYSSRGLHVTSFHPIFILSGLQVYSGESVESMFEVPKTKARKQSIAQGAATTVHAALSRDWEGKGGIYLSNCAVICPFRKQPPKSVYDDEVTNDG
ncbi:hypothetical protein BDR22DRAFT_880291 [Usnea florida]